MPSPLKYSFASLLLISMQSSVHANVPSWSGWYLGALAGGANSSFNMKTSTEPGGLIDTNRAEAINRAGDQKLTRDGFLAGVSGGYNWQIKNVLLGLETDVQALSIDDTINSGAVVNPSDPAHQFVITSYASENWLLTARPRVGLVTNRGLLYVTGGLAVAYVQNDFLYVSNILGSESQQVKQFKPGYAIGAGYEAGLTENVSLKLEYLHTKFNNTTATPMNYNLTDAQAFKNTANASDNIIRLGVNYHFNHSSLALSPQLIPLLFNANQWQVEIGVRPFYSIGEVGSPQPLFNSPGSVLASRLIYKNLDAVSLESFARIDHARGLFLKGYLGAGTIMSGQLHDEDFPALNAYSNTLSQASGNLSYATADIGYSVINTARGKSGVFIGYNYYAQNIDTYGCRQLANDVVCVPSNELDNLLGLSENNYFKSLRLGLISQVDITNRLSISTEASYLPIVQFNGQDNHNARQLILPEQSSSGNGSMLESVLSYQLTDSWNIGLGARYWLWNMHGGTAKFNFLGEQSGFIEPARFNTYRYGFFLQLNYAEKALNYFHFSSSPFAWRGLYVGGNLGGAWGYSDWSDPFSESPAFGGYTNAPKFGDNLHSTGPLADIDVHYYWQLAKYVVGLGANFGVADMRGENTLFSGMGGVNGQGDTRRFILLLAKAGVTYDRSLFYLQAGPALLKTKYNINANTHFVTFGMESQTVSQWGAAIGAGIDYALTENWTTKMEYNYIHTPSTTLSFPGLVTLNEHRYSVNQNMNIVQVGLDYKLF